MNRRAWLAFAAISLIWGIPYLLIRIAVRHGVTPAAVAWGRVALAALVLLALAANTSFGGLPVLASLLARQLPAACVRAAG